jgi:hypothetical protein
LTTPRRSQCYVPVSIHPEGLDLLGARSLVPRGGRSADPGGVVLCHSNARRCALTGRFRVPAAGCGAPVRYTAIWLAADQIARLVLTRRVGLTPRALAYDVDRSLDAISRAGEDHTGGDGPDPGRPPDRAR